MIDLIAKNLPALQVVIPLMAAPVCAIFNRSRLAWLIAFVVAIASFAMSAALLGQTLDGGIISYLPTYPFIRLRLTVADAVKTIQ